MTDRYERTPPAARRKQGGDPVELDRYDPGLLGGQDGMPAYVWHDIIRAELDRAYDFYMDQIDRAASQPAEPDEWKLAVDHELTNMQYTADSYPSAKDAVKALIDWHVAVATDPVFQQPTEPVKVPKGYVLVAENYLEGMIGSELMDQLRQSCRFPTSKHAPGTISLTDEHKDVLKGCRNVAIEWSMRGRIPECGKFSQIAQDLDYLCNQLGIDND